jgi:hypothetical protein
MAADAFWDQWNDPKSIPKSSFFLGLSKKGLASLSSDLLPHSD